MSKFTVFDQSSGMYVHPNNFLDPEAPYVFNSYDEALAAKWEMLAANRDQKHPDSIDIEPFVVGEEPGGLKRPIMEPRRPAFLHGHGQRLTLTWRSTSSGVHCGIPAVHLSGRQSDKGVKP